jgi:hypothetical protein
MWYVATCPHFSTMRLAKYWKSYSHWSRFNSDIMVIQVNSWIWTSCTISYEIDMMMLYAFKICFPTSVADNMLRGPVYGSCNILQSWREKSRHCRLVNHNKLIWLILKICCWIWGKYSFMQSEGIEVSAEMEFFTKQNIMLDLENKALKQRLESLAQKQLIKRCKYVLHYFFYL